MIIIFFHNTVLYQKCSLPSIPSYSQHDISICHRMVIIKNCTSGWYTTYAILLNIWYKIVQKRHILFKIRNRSYRWYDMTFIFWIKFQQIICNYDHACTHIFPNSTYKTYSANEKWQLKYVKEENIVNCNERNFTKNTSLFADPIYL